MRIFTLSLFTALFFTSLSVNAQCTFPQGMAAQPYKYDNQCIMFIQFAIPGSNVSIANANGYVAQGTAGVDGSVGIPYDCAERPITGVLSITTSGQFCTTVIFATEVTLPVKFESFTVEATTPGALLKWSTSFEFNNAKYIVEKSIDGRSYQTVGEVAGAINSIELNRYTFTDATFKPGDIAFYRLKQVDLDGTSAFSKVVYINNSKDKSQTLRIAPNPFLNEDIQLIGISASELNKKNIRIFNLAGKQINFEFTGSNAMRLDPSLPKGMYFLNINGSSYKLLKN